MFIVVSWFMHTQLDDLAVLLYFFFLSPALDISLTQVSMDFPKNLGVTPEF
jgi:hypothetical protein